MYADSSNRHYVDLTYLTSAAGVVTPLDIRWEDGRHFEVLQVTERRRAHSARAGGCGIRYTVRIGTHWTHLFFDDYRGRWFVEGRGGTGA